jgi:prephenate dehydratase
MGVPVAPVTVAFQGEHGAFSEEAARRVLGPEAATHPQHTFEQVFEVVVSRRVACAVVPLENTLAGSIISNYDLLLEHDLSIVGEVVLRVVHNLIVPPGVTIEAVKRVYSHPVALAQCGRFLVTHPRLTAVPHEDTAGAVKMIMEEDRRDQAAIASSAAAKVYGAEILVSQIESHEKNYTRFCVLARPDRAADIPVQTGSTEARKTSIVFRIDNRPGALHRTLAVFAEESIDLAKIESRPIPGRPWEYSFYLDFLGDRGDDAVKRALANLSGLTEDLRVLGSYPKAEL